MPNQIAVVTGAGSGIGLAVAERLSQGGWTVVLAGRTADKLTAAADRLEGETLCVPTDVTSEEEVDRLFETTFQTYGRIDLLFNNAGIASAPASVEDVDSSDFRKVLETNVMGCFLCAKAAMKRMKQQGDGGRIINNGSLSAYTPRPGSVAYTVSKHAVLGLTKSIALDGRASNVACGQIDFGNVVSDMSQAMVGGPGALQANGDRLQEPTMRLEDAAETVWTMANLPLSANVLTMTVMATKMPYVGRG